MNSLDLVAHFADFIKTQPLSSNGKLVLAYSGGVDSEVLAYGLSQFAQAQPGFSCQLVHVHHGLSPNADVWAQHCEMRARQYGLPITIEYVQVQQGPRLSLEAQARSARYLALQKHLNAGDVLLTAHHEDDQLETILLALKRGQGPKGLAAMGPVQAYHQGWQMRPLLDVSRAHIEAYAKQMGLVHIEDESNQDSHYDRNFLRLHIIPQLKARWPSIATTASRSAALCAAQQKIVDEQVQAQLPQWLGIAKFTQQEVFNLAGFEALSAQWQALLLRAFIQSQGFSLPSLVQLNELIQQLCHAKDDAHICLRLADGELRCFAKQLYLMPACPQSQTLPPTPWLVNTEDLQALMHEHVPSLQLNVEHYQQTVCILSTDKGMRVRLPQPHETVSIRYRVAGKWRCQPHNRSKGRELKKLMQEFEVPPWERERVACVFYDDKLVTAVGLWVEKAYQIVTSEKGLRFEYMS